MKLKSAYLLFLIFAANYLKSQNTTWTIINKSNSLLPSDTVNAIAIDKFGTKWIGTENGLAKYSSSTWTIYKTSNSGIPSNKVSSVTIDSLGNKWIGTRGAGLALFDNSNWTVFNATNSLIIGKNIGDVAIDSLNNKWVVSNVLTKLGPLNQSLSAWGVPYCTNVSQDTILNTIAIDKNDFKWIGSTIEGVNYCSNTFITMNVGTVNTIENKGNDVWMGLDYGFLISGNIAGCGNFNFTLHYPSEMGLNDNKVSSIAFDTCGYAWIGTKTGGLGMYSGIPSNTLGLTTSNSPLPTNKIKCIATIGNEKWIGTTKGIALLNTSCQYQYTNTAISIESAPVIEKIEVFPNPCNSFLKIKGTFSKLEFLDIFGNIVFTEIFKENPIDLSEISSGFYFLRVTDKKNNIYTIKIVKD